MSDITLSKAVRSSLLNLQNTATMLAKTQERLASGNKVDSALDNPTNYFTAAALNSRAADLNNLMDSMSNGLKAIEAADNGLDAISKIVEGMQATLRQARQDNSFKAQSFEIDRAAVGDLGLSGGAVGQSVQPISLVDYGITRASVTASAAYAPPTEAIGPRLYAGAPYQPSAATSPVLTAPNAYIPLDFSTGGEYYNYEIRYDIYSLPIQLNETDAAGSHLTITEARDAFNARLVASDLRVRINDNDALEFYDTKTGSSAGFTLYIRPAYGRTTTDSDAIGWPFSYGGSTGAHSAQGTDAVDRVVSISSAAGTTGNITLNSTNAATAAQARATIQSAIDGVPALQGTITVGGSGNNIDLRGAANGPGTFTVGGADAASVFGSNPTVASSASAVDRVITITTAAGTTGNITLTSANAATAAQARATIHQSIDANPSLNGTITVGGTGDNIDLLGAPDGSNTIVVGGADATAVFGASYSGKTGVVSTGGRLRPVDELVREINFDRPELKNKIRASNDNGKLRIENLSTADLTVGGIGHNGKIVGTAGGTVSIGGNEIRKNFVEQFNELRDQLDKLADDASFNGINLLRGDELKVTFNETGTSFADIQTRDGRQVNAASLNIFDLNAVDLDSAIDIDMMLDNLQAALIELRSQAAFFGSSLAQVQNRQDFTRAMIDTLHAGAGNLTLADMNEEAANLLALQTRQQLSSKALSMASQDDQSVLQILR
jgi:flagellin